MDRRSRSSPESRKPTERFFRINPSLTIEVIEVRAVWTVPLGGVLFVMAAVSVPAQAPSTVPDFSGVYYTYNPGRAGGGGGRPGAPPAGAQRGAPPAGAPR